MAADGAHHSMSLVLGLGRRNESMGEPSSPLRRPSPVFQRSSGVMERFSEGSDPGDVFSRQI